jgi:hypothetical protein
MTRRKKWDSERKKAAIEAMRSKKMDNYTTSRVFNLPQTALQSYFKDRESSSEATKQNWQESKVFLVKENLAAEYCLLMERKSLGLTVADVMCLTYQLAVKNGIKKTNLHEK